MLGFWYSLVFEKNKVRQDPFLTGALFCREFFELIRIVALEDSDENKIKKAAIVLREKFPLLSDVILTLSAESKKEYAELMLLDLEESSLENAVLKIQEYLNAAKSFYEGCEGTFQKELKEGDLASVMISLQGEEISKENLLKALQIVANNSSRNMKIFLKECKWIEEKIQNSTQEWMIQFVKAITGKATLSPHTKIVIKESWRNVFEIHTCFNSLDLPVILEKDTFLAALDAAISGNGYNIS